MSEREKRAYFFILFFVFFWPTGGGGRAQRYSKRQKRHTASPPLYTLAIFTLYTIFRSRVLLPCVRSRAYTYKYVTYAHDASMSACMRLCIYARALCAYIRILQSITRSPSGPLGCVARARGNDRGKKKKKIRKQRLGIARVFLFCFFFLLLFDRFYRFYIDSAPYLFRRQNGFVLPGDIVA